VDEAHRTQEGDLGRKMREVRIPRHGGHDSTLMADSVPA